MTALNIIKNRIFIFNYFNINKTLEYMPQLFRQDKKYVRRYIIMIFGYLFMEYPFYFINMENDTKYDKIRLLLLQITSRVNLIISGKILHKIINTELQCNTINVYMLFSDFNEVLPFFSSIFKKMGRIQCKPEEYYDDHIAHMFKLEFVNGDKKFTYTFYLLYGYYYDIFKVTNMNDIVISSNYITNSGYYNFKHIDDIKRKIINKYRDYNIYSDFIYQIKKFYNTDYVHIDIEYYCRIFMAFTIGFCKIIKSEFTKLMIKNEKQIADAYGDKILENVYYLITESDLQIPINIIINLIKEFPKKLKVIKPHFVGIDDTLSRAFNDTKIGLLCKHISFPLCSINANDIIYTVNEFAELKHHITSTNKIVNLLIEALNLFCKEENKQFDMYKLIKTKHDFIVDLLIKNKFYYYVVRNDEYICNLIEITNAHKPLNIDYTKHKYKFNKHVTNAIIKYKNTKKMDFNIFDFNDELFKDNIHALRAFNIIAIYSSIDFIRDYVRLMNIIYQKVQRLVNYRNLGYNIDSISGLRMVFNLLINKGDGKYIIC